MTERELLKNALIETNKLEAPALLLDDYLYFINKAVQQYTNEVYNSYETTQQTTDDLRVLKRTAIIPLEEDSESLLPEEESTYSCYLPTDYLHMLSCVVGFEKTKDVSPKKNAKLGVDETPFYMGRMKETVATTKSRCPNKDTAALNATIKSPARKLTSNLYPMVLTNAYFKPSYKVPYYYINRVSAEGEADPYSVLQKIIDPTSTPDPNVVDSTSVRMEIRCGETKKYSPTIVYVDYIKTPRTISITQEDIDSIEDTTDEIEFPDYVCYEIINRFTMLLMENASDPRIQTNAAVNQSIARPQ